MEMKKKQLGYIGAKAEFLVGLSVSSVHSGWKVISTDISIGYSGASFLA